MENEPTIFRRSVYERYLRGREKAVMPRFVSPRGFLVLWTLVALVLVGVLVAWLTRIPIHAEATAVVVRWDGSEPLEGDELALAVFLPPRNLPQIARGQDLFVRWNRNGPPLRCSFAAVDPEVRGPDDLVERFFLRGAAASALTQPVAVALAPWRPPPELAGGNALGSVFPAEVQIGRRRALALMPGLDRVFEMEP